LKPEHKKKRESKKKMNTANLETKICCKMRMEKMAKTSFVTTISVLSALFFMITILTPISTSAQNVFYEAIKEGNLTEVTKIVNTGIDINSIDQEGETPLHIALIDGRFKIAKYLINKGADVNARCNTGATPLIHAVRFRVLLFHDTGGQFAKKLEPSSDPDQSEVVKLLMSKGADVNAADKIGATPLIKGDAGTKTTYYFVILLVVTEDIRLIPWLFHNPKSEIRNGNMVSWWQ
jgi:hypothetical protein